ncbi:hypothetical protein, partial [Yeosuana marina]|uniref:hypothetical protein n=1 Tax=Yeosuana marina TaxID=1565536 RepID=UPI0030C7DF96
MTKYVYFILFYLGLSLNLFSQETNIETEFSQDGALYENIDNFSNPLVEFENHEKCIVIDYLGKDKYKIKYKEWEGFVDSQYLVVTEDMMDLFYAYQEKQRIEALKQEEDRRHKIQEIVRKNNELEEVELLKESIAKVNEEEKKQQGLEELARKNLEYLNEKRLQDSIAKIKEAKKKEQELQEQSKREKILQDSISSVKESEKKQQELEELARRNQEYLKEKGRQDSIAMLVEEQKKQQELQEQSKREKILQDSIS